MFEDFELSKLAIIDIITFDLNKFSEQDVVNLTEEIAQWVSSNDLDLGSFTHTMGTDRLNINMCYTKTKDKMLVRYDKFTNLDDALKFKEFMTKLYSRNIHIEKQTWMCQEKEIERCFMLKAL
jgi:hypothetical protein